MPCARPCADLGRGFGVLGEQKLAADRAERRAKRHLAESLDALRAELLEPNLTAKEADWTRRKPAIQLDQEPAIMVREPDATRQATPHDIQLMSKHRVLSFKPQLRLEWRGQDGQNETEQRSFRQLRRFHHGFNSDKIFGTHRQFFDAKTEDVLIRGAPHPSAHITSALSAPPPRT
jgi:hypothetical protein